METIYQVAKLNQKKYACMWIVSANQEGFNAALKSFIESSNEKLLISMTSRFNVWWLVDKTAEHTSFHYSYFFYSKLALKVDWLTAISGERATSWKYFQRHGIAGLSDWYNVYKKLVYLDTRVFLIVIDNSEFQDERFSNTLNVFLKNLKAHTSIIKKDIKFLFIKRNQN